MTNKTLQFIQTTPQELSELIKDEIKTLIEDLKSNLSIQNQDELLSREQTCKFFQIDSSTLWHWTNKGRVKAYAICGRRFYKKSELLDALTLVKSTIKRVA